MKLGVMLEVDETFKVIRGHGQGNIFKLFATTVHYGTVSYSSPFYGFPSVIAPAFSTPAVCSHIFHFCIFRAPTPPLYWCTL